MTPTLLDISAHLSASLAGAERLLPLEDSIDEVDLWLQGWGSTACGHPGIGGHAMTQGVVVAVVTTQRRAFIFSQGRLLHSLPYGEEVAIWIKNRKVPPAPRS